MWGKTVFNLTSTLISNLDLMTICWGFDLLWYKLNWQYPKREYCCRCWPDRCPPFPSWWRFVQDGTSVCGVARSFDVSQECGRDAVRWALTLWERARRLSRMASICSSLWGGTEGPSMFLTTLWELDSMRWREGPASCCGILVLNLPENAKTGRLTTGAPFSSEIRADSHWACMIDVKESEEAECD